MPSPLPKPNLPGQVFPPASAPVTKAVPITPNVPLPGQLPRPPLVSSSFPLSAPPAAAVGAQPQAALKSVQPSQVLPSAATLGSKPPIAQTPGTTAKENNPIFAKAKNSPLKFLPIVLGGLLLLAVIVFAAMKFLGGNSNQSVSIDQGDTGDIQPGQQGAAVGSTKQTILTYWGLWEANATVETVLEEFGLQNPGVIVEYKKNSPTEYRERLQSSIAAGNGPDVFRFHASWVPMLKVELDSMPSSIMSASDYKKTYYPVAAEQLLSGNKILGVPLMYDGLALYYNKKALETASVEVPQSWSELKTAASKLTIRSEGKIERAGVALGTANNVEHFSDILALLILQNGASLNDPSSTEAQQALRFYTDFYTKSKVWDETMTNSTVAFAKGDVAMMFAPSWRAHEVQALNPDLDFDIVPVPKLTESHVAWASFWAEGVSSQSKNKELAWKLIDYLSSPTVLKKLYSTQNQIRSFGEIYPRVDMAEELINAKYVSAYLEDAPVATSWYMNSYTHDNGLNDRMISYYEDAVNSVISGSDPGLAMDTVASGSAQVLRQYGASSSSR